MNDSRRTFLKVAGAAAVGAGLGAAPVLTALAADPQYKDSPKELKAKRWAMVVDTRKFNKPEDFQPCIEACHTVHNVPGAGKPDVKREIKWLWTDGFENVFPDLVMNYPAEEIEHKQFFALCNHCENPPCVRVCPTKATFKRADNIVMMDMHRCIGCRYCMAGCPYGARSFNFLEPRPYLDPAKINPKYPPRMRGVVEKCTFCTERLDEGLMPACVEASKGGLAFGDLADPNSEVRKLLRENFTIRRKSELGTQPGVYYII
jgi:molybdopterin-containing oxidoreductase family iron-sulfur binding subunit